MDFKKIYMALIKVVSEKYGVEISTQIQEKNGI